MNDLSAASTAPRRFQGDRVSLLIGVSAYLYRSPLRLRHPRFGHRKLTIRADVITPARNATLPFIPSKTNKSIK